MRMLVVGIMNMRVSVFDFSMQMHMFVPLGEVKPYARTHQQARHTKLHSQWFAERDYCA